ncbi:MAG: ribose 5-phosphate isomerase B [Anaerolineae bacterium]|nr:ribose 5-phosphate isomerase B [Anaerolineae bacterium]
MNAGAPVAAPPAPAAAAPQPAAAAPFPNANRSVAIGADHGGYELKELLKTDLIAQGYAVQDVGTHSQDAVDYPDLAFEVAKLVGNGTAWRGIMIDGAGIGSCMAANKVPGVRAGMAYDLSSALNSREHNDANLLTLGAGLIGANLAKQIVQTWLATEFGGGRHTRRVEKIKAIEKLTMK